MYSIHAFFLDVSDDKSDEDVAAEIRDKFRDSYSSVFLRGSRNWFFQLAVVLSDGRFV